MDWYQVALVFGSNLALFLWAIRQSRADFYHLDRKLEENRKETNSIIKAIQEEIKDFHVKLERQDAEFKAHMIYEHKK